MKNLTQKEIRVKDSGAGSKYEPVVDEFVDDSTVIFEAERLEKGRWEEMSQKMLVRHHRVRNQVGVVDHCNW